MQEEDRNIKEKSLDEITITVYSNNPCLKICCDVFGTCKEWQLTGWDQTDRQQQPDSCVILGLQFITTDEEQWVT